MTRSAYLRISATIFGVVAVAHAIRAVLNVPAHVGDVAIPMWVSWAGIVGAGLLSIWGFSAAGRK